MPTPNFEDGVQNQKVLAAMEKAAATKRWVTVSSRQQAELRQS